MKKIVIIGGGLTGISCAYKLEKLGYDYILFEKETSLGGLCRSVYKDGFIFDYTGHFLHISTPEIKSFVKKILGNNILEILRNSKIYTKYAKKNFIPYPFQANIKFLKKNVLKKCLKDLLLAFLKNDSKQQDGFQSWVQKNFGESIAKYFFLPYNTKVWSYPLDKISSSFAKRFIPTINIEEIFENILYDKKKDYGYNIKFFYPEFGGIQSLINGIEQMLSQQNVKKGVKIESINYKKKEIKLSTGEKVLYSQLVSTIPLTELLNITNFPESIKKLKKYLVYTGVKCYNIVIKKRVLKGVHWIYFPDTDIKFYRVGFYHNVSRNLVKPGYSSLYVEVSYRGKQKNEYDEIVKDLIKTKIINSKEDIVFCYPLDIPVAYVIYRFDTEKILDIIKKFLVKNNIYSIGRYGGWKYSFMEENIREGFEIAEKLVRR